MEQSSSTTSEERQARIQRKIDANIRCKGFFKNINLWKNTIALRDCDRVNVLCDFLEAQFENADPSWDDYWLDLRSFALTWSRLDGITPVSQEAFAKYKKSCDPFDNSETRNILAPYVKELRDTAIAFLRTQPLDRNIRYIEEIIADGLGDRHLSLEVLTKHSQKYNRSIDNLLVSINNGDSEAARTIVNALDTIGISNIMSCLTARAKAGSSVSVEAAMIL
jgi:hypothetical protein